MSTSKKAKKTENTYPKPVGSRFDQTTIDRMDAVATAISKKMKTTVRKSNVLEMCVQNQLPKLEQEYGIPAPQPQEEVAA